MDEEGLNSEITMAIIFTDPTFCDFVLIFTMTGRMSPRSRSFLDRKVISGKRNYRVVSKANSELEKDNKEGTFPQISRNK